MISAQQHRSRTSKQVNSKLSRAHNQSRARKEAVTESCSEKLDARRNSSRPVILAEHSMEANIVLNTGVTPVSNRCHSA